MLYSIKLGKSKTFRINSRYFLILSYVLSAVITFIVYIAGGTNKVYTNLMYMPIAIVSSTNGKKHGIAHAVINGLLVGPFMPLYVEQGLMQAPINWILRMLTYSVIAYVIGLFADHYRQELVNVQKRDDEIFEAQMATIYSLVKLSESRDLNTGEHIMRVAELCRLLASKLSSMDRFSGYITDEYIDYISKAAPLHDIGKVGIPDSILLKPGKLTPEEFEIMKSHTIIGENTLMEVKQRYPRYRFLELAVHITRYHHERWDGTGYPDGLSGEAIPLSARIMALADTYDALRSKRTYKEAYSHEESIEIIRQGVGNHYDPVIARVFLESENEIASLYI
jgi:response regulator RpfG family c-di-GMP phosphodiesterase